MLPAHPVGEEACRIGNQRRHEIERGVDQDRVLQRAVDILGPQDQKRVAGIAKPEQGRSQPDTANRRGEIG